MSKLLHGSTLITEDSGKNSGGKKFTTWKIDNHLANKKIEVLVSFHNDNDMLYFMAVIPEYKLKLQNSDINKLKEDIHEFIYNKVNEEKNIRWEEWLQIKITRSICQNSVEKRFTIDVKVSDIPKGFDDNKPGEEFTLNINNIIVPFPKSGKFEEKELLVKGSNGVNLNFNIGESPHSVTFMKNTPENKLALEKFLNELNNFTDRLQDFILEDSFRQDLIQIVEKTNLLK